MSISDSGIPLSILDYSFEKSNSSELEPHLSMPMDDIFGLSYHENLGSNRELDLASQLAASKQNMSLLNNENPPPSMPSSSLKSFPSSELEATELDQYLTMEDTFGLSEHEIFPFGDDPIICSDLFDIFPFDNELINKYEMAGQFKEISDQGNSGQPSTDIKSSEPLPNKDILSFEQNPNPEGAKPISLCTTSDDEAFHGEKDEDKVELVQLLLLSARMIGEGKYDHASAVLSKCQKMSCQRGNPTQRLGYYVSAALQERMECQTGRMLNKPAKPVRDFAYNIDAEIDKNEFTSLLAYWNIVLPFVNVFQFTSVQAIIDAVGNAQRVHIIDLGMRGGVHWTVLMEYLAHRSSSSSLSTLELLKFTAVGMDGEELWKTGKRLRELAKSFAIPLSYSMVEIGGIEEIKEGLFSVKSGEALAIYAPIVLRSLLYDPVLLENLIKVIRKMKPRILVNIELEATHNSPSFVNRFSEVLFHYIPYFDMLDATMTDRNDSMRVKHEELLTASQIRNMIVYEGKERFVRHVTTDVWRCLFKKAGFKERSFSFKAMYQARLLLRESASGEYYTLEADGDAIIIKWKGTPFFSISAWTGYRTNFNGVL